VVPVELPPLRERAEDIPLLVEELLKRLNRRLDRNVQGFTPEAMVVLQSYPWPGNIRELENIMERTLLFAERPIIDVADLPPDLPADLHTKLGSLRPGSATHSADPSARESQPSSMKDIVRQATAELERDLIQGALDETQGNVTHAARRLKISRKSLQIKMKELGLRDETRPPDAAADAEEQGDAEDDPATMPPSRT
jgi:DNA-binding NtrC family response regulator